MASPTLKLYNKRFSKLKIDVKNVLMHFLPKKLDNQLRKNQNRSKQKYFNLEALRKYAHINQISRQLSLNRSLEKRRRG